jgi:hypothetical protein
MKFTSRRVAVAAVVATGSLFPLLAASPAGASTTSANIIVNGDAEAGTGGVGQVVPIPSWHIVAGLPDTVIKYNTTGFLLTTDPVPSNHKKNYFAGGPDNPNQTLNQTDSLSAFKTSIDAGTAKFKLSAWLGGLGGFNDSAGVEVDFKDASGNFVGSSIILGPVTSTDRGGVSALLERTAKGKVPVGARKVYVQLFFNRDDSSPHGYNYAFADSLSMKIVTP